MIHVMQRTMLWTTSTSEEAVTRALQLGGGVGEACVHISVCASFVTGATLPPVSLHTGQTGGLGVRGPRLMCPNPRVC